MVTTDILWELLCWFLLLVVLFFGLYTTELEYSSSFNVSLGRLLQEPEVTWLKRAATGAGSHVAHVGCYTGRSRQLTESGLGFDHFNSI